MTEAEWLVCGEPGAMLDVVCDRADERKMLLFALAGCRRIERFLTDHEKNCRASIALLEMRIEGTASTNDLQSALGGVTGEMFGHARNPGDAEGYALFAATDVVHHVREGNWKRLTESVSETVAYDVLARSGNRDLAQIDVVWVRRTPGRHWESDEDAVKCLPEYVDALKVERGNQADLVRDIFGNPFRPVAFSPEWRTGTVVSLARGMYDSRDFSAVPILADALQDAGCDNADVLNHCRGEGPHVRGCWVVDLVLGKE